MEDYSTYFSDDKPSSFYIENIRKIEPIYDFESATGLDGHFEVRVGLSENTLNKLELPFKVIIHHRLKEDENLLDFLKDNYADKGLSKAIADLYDIGFPVNDWVKDYLTDCLDNSPKYYALLSLINFLKSINGTTDDKDSKDNK